MRGTRYDITIIAFHKTILSPLIPDRWSPTRSLSSLLAPRQLVYNPSEVELPIELVHLGQLYLQVGEIALGQTAHDVEPLQASLLLPLGKLQEGVDALLLGVADEATGVDDGYLALRPLAVVRTAIAAFFQERHQSLGVHQILRTSERYEVDRFFLSTQLFFPFAYLLSFVVEQRIDKLSAVEEL